MYRNLTELLEAYDKIINERTDDPDIQAAVRKFKTDEFLGVFFEAARGLEDAVVAATTVKRISQ